MAHNNKRQLVRRVYKAQKVDTKCHDWITQVRSDRSALDIQLGEYDIQSLFKSRFNN